MARNELKKELLHFKDSIQKNLEVRSSWIQKQFHIPSVSLWKILKVRESFREKNKSNKEQIQA